MLKRTLALTAAVAFVTACGTGPTGPSAPPALDVGAAANDHTTLPEPGTKSCRGQATAAFAQAGKNEGVPEAHGIGGVSRYLDIPVGDIKDAIAAYCSGV